MMMGMTSLRLYSAAFGMASLFAVAGAHAETGLPWSSSFESSDLSEWNGWDTGSVVITNDVAGDGDQSAYVKLDAGTLNNNYLEHYFGDHTFIGLDPVDEVYLSFQSRFDSGYEFPDRQGHKLALLNLTDDKGQRRYQVYLWVNSRGEYVVDNAHIDTWDFPTVRQNVGEVAKVGLDKWDKLTLYVRLDVPGRNNGVIRLWVNDELKLDHEGLNLRDDTRFTMNKLILSSYTTSQRGGSGVQRYDDWLLSETKPDGVGESDAPPRAPTGLRVTD